jgi:hypothetical protein
MWNQNDLLEKKVIARAFARATLLVFLKEDVIFYTSKFHIERNVKLRNTVSMPKLSTYSLRPKIKCLFVLRLRHLFWDGGSIRFALCETL